MATQDAHFGQWLTSLRDRFVDIASRRVRADDVDDVVQEAMRVVVERTPDRVDDIDGMPPLAWCFQVLRNTIGNHYKRRRTQNKWVDGAAAPDASAPDATPLEALESERALRVIEEALESLASADPQCGRYLRRTLDGVTANHMAREEELEPSVFYKRLYRCRQKLREVLRERGVSA